MCVSSSLLFFSFFNGFSFHVMRDTVWNLSFKILFCHSDIFYFRKYISIIIDRYIKVYKSVQKIISYSR